MSKNTSIFIFHRSLRLDDNRGLIEALRVSKVLPIFIFSPDQITDNAFRSVPAIRFMISALMDLDAHLRRHGSKMRFYYGQPDAVLNSVLRDPKLTKLGISSVYLNKDYTPYAKQREADLQTICDANDVELHSIEDYLLLPINSVTNVSGSYYSVFTPFYNNAVKHKVDKPVPNKKSNYVSKTAIVGKMKYEIELSAILPKIKFKGGLSKVGLPNYKSTRAEGLKRIELIKNHRLYEKNRNNIAMSNSTTLLSPYIKFGIVSVREVYHRILSLFGRKHTLISQLFWREFYYNIAYNRPDVLKGKSFRPSYDKIRWKRSAILLKKWKTGTTGVPIVDAAMRELVQSNFMHNRGRLITSNYLVKHYLIDWKEGEKFFAQHLVDYDPAVNNGNWQWSAGSGADAQPYFRQMNPWAQGKKYDPDCLYIKKWIPELQDVPAQDIHNWQNTHAMHDVDYPKPYLTYDFAKLTKASKSIYSTAKYKGKSKSKSKNKRKTKSKSKNKSRRKTRNA